MNDVDLIKALKKHGIDESGIADRFGDNHALYARCIRDFLHNANFALLDKAVADGEYSLAFDYAHAIKGLAGNLGLNDYYSAICVLVESLRAKNNFNAKEELAAANMQLSLLKKICSEEIADSQLTGSPTGSQIIDKKQDKQGEKEKSEKDKFILSAIFSVVCVFVIAVAAFLILGKTFREKTKFESGVHLSETAKQISIYLEEQIENDWRTALNVANRFEARSDLTDEDIVGILLTQQENWDVSDLMLYTDNGYCIYSNGDAQYNGIASQTIADVYQNGQSMSIIDSKIIYTIKVDTAQLYLGEKIVAISVVRNMETFLDDMDISAYQDEAWIYLCEENGIVVSMLDQPNAVKTFNIKTLFESAEMTPLTNGSQNNELFTSPGAIAFYMEDFDCDRYVVSSPVAVRNGMGNDTVGMRFFYIVAEDIVNNAMNGFYSNLTVFSVVIIIILVGFACFTFFTLYKNRKRQFDEAINAREKMFDLLIQNIKTVFGLFNTESPKPLYISNNVSEVLGEEYLTLNKVNDVYFFSAASGNQLGMIKRINTLLVNWDGKSVFRSEYICDDKKPDSDWFRLTLYPVSDNLCDYVGIISHATNAYRHEEATKNAMQMAKRSDEAKTKFLANMSHDIRTPMNAIMNMSRFALEDRENMQMRDEYLKTIYESSEHLLRLINDILDMSRIESGQIVISTEPFSLAEELEIQVETIKSLCKEKNQNFISDLSGLSSQFVSGDATKVNQIVLNLLSNAVKFTPQYGLITFTANEFSSLDDDFVDVRLVVTDNGIGIAKEDQEKIFDPFVRLGERQNEDKVGTGLGLAICKSYVQAMGGVIACKSEPNLGSIFTVELFFRKCKPNEIVQTIEYGTDTTFNGMRALVAEDIDTNRQIAKTMLEKIGFSVDLAMDGAQAFSIFTHSNPDTYDVIYMDIQMPVLDGHQACVMIRQSNHVNAKNVPILAMSANVFIEDIEKARIVGMDGYIGKPIVMSDLIAQTIKAFEIRKGKK